MNRTITTLSFFLIFAFFLSKTARAVDASNFEEQKNAFSLSIFDQQLLYSLNYDRTINKYFGLGVSTSIIGGGGTVVAIGGVRALAYPIRSKTTAPFVTAGVHGLTHNNTYGFDSLDGSYWWGSTGIGVEYRNHFLFRASINALFNSDGYLAPFPGLTFGYAF